MPAPPRHSPTASFAPPARLARALAVTTPLVCALGLAAELVYAYGPEAAQLWVPVFSLSFEANVPTWYIASLLLACALSLAAAGAEESDPRPWWALGAVFVLMSLDETAQFHENLYVLAEGDGVFYFSWVIPGAAIALAVAVAFARFWWRLPPPTRARFAIAGGLYVAGALVMELPLGYWTERAGSDNLVYGLIDWVEETMEISGASLFWVAIARHRARQEVPV